MNEGSIYPDRRAAGKLLADQLVSWVGSKPIILSLPRGGAIIGAEVAKALSAEHDLVICRKIGAPYNAEVAIGALTQDGQLLKDDAIIDVLAVTKGYLESQIRLELKEIERQLSEFRGEKVFPDLRNKTVVLVDDGLATGFTMEAAVEFIRRLGPSRIIVGVPVGAAEAIAKLKPKVDQVVCPLIPKKFWAVGQFYQNFHQVSDDEVRKLFKG
ncbi:MAG: phosphoribosyltransferase [Bacteroidota bacterium]